MFIRTLIDSGRSGELSRAHTAFQTLRACHRVLVHSRYEPQLVEGFCGNLYRDGGYRHVWVAMGDPASEGRLRVVGQAGDSAPEPLPETLAVAEPLITVLREGCSLLENHVEAAAVQQPWFAWARSLGYGSCVVVPLCDGGHTIGIMVAGRERADALDAMDLELLEELSKDLVVGLTSVRSRQSSANLLEAMEASADVVGLLTADGRVSYCNAAGLRTLGHRRQADVVGHRVGEIHPEWATRLILDEGLPTALREGRWQAETAVLAGNGEEIPVSQLIVAHRDHSGAGHFFSTILRDLRPHRQGEARLLENEATVRRILHSAREGLRLIDSYLKLPEPHFPYARLPVQKGNQTLIFDLDSICYLRADGHYTRVHTMDSELLSTESLSQLERQLDPTRFLRTHRSYIVNVNRIQAIERSERQVQLVLQNQERHVVPVSRRNAELVRKTLGFDL